MEKNFTHGFTLIEILIAIFIFGILGTVAVNLFVSSLTSQRYVLASQKVSDETALLMESMSRLVREAKRDDFGECIGAGLNFQIVNVGGFSALQFIDGNGKCRYLLFDNVGKKIGEQVSTNRSAGNLTAGLGGYLTSDGIEINDFRFILSGESSSDDLQPRVTLFIDATPRNFPSGNPPRLQIQTTLSQRNLDE